MPSPSTTGAMACMLAAGLATGLAACTVDAPPVDVGPNDGPPRESTFADVVLAQADESGAVACEALPTDCPTSGPCAEHPSLGAPVGSAFVLDDLAARLEVGFLCSQILERGVSAPMADFRIWATVPEGAEAVVSVSLDGSTYRDVDVLVEDHAELDLQRARVEVARFVRIALRAGGGIAVDAVEALGDEP